MKSFTQTLCLAAAWFVLPVSAQGGESASARPNIVVFIADDMSWDDIGAYGHPSIRTPNLDRLAREGMRFDEAWLTASSCSPSRASMLTGRYPHNTNPRPPVRPNGSFRGLPQKTKL
jgi:N-sulfoglucosamine sulfohydrolase